MHVLKLSSYVLSVSMLALAPIQSAKAQRHGQYGQSPSQACEQKVETVFANTYLSGSDKINLTRILKLAPGETLKKVKVTASSSSYGAKLVMKVNGQRVDAVQLLTTTPLKEFCRCPCETSAADKLFSLAIKARCMWERSKRQFQALTPRAQMKWTF